MAEYNCFNEEDRQQLFQICDDDDLQLLTDRLTDIDRIILLHGDDGNWPERA